MTQVAERTAHPDTVYHITGLKKLGSVMVKGLEPNHNRDYSKVWGEAEKLLDAQRPQRVIDMGITRAAAVYAHPDVDMIKSRDAMGAFRTRRHEKDTSIALSVAVARPEQILVCDADTIGDVTRRLSEGDEEAAERYAEKYWKESVTLADFRKFYTSTYEMGYWGTEPALRVEHVRNDDAPNTLPYVFFQPEVLIPGPVEPDRLAWAASSAHPIK